MNPSILKNWLETSILNQCKEINQLYQDNDLTLCISVDDQSTFDSVFPSYKAVAFFYKKEYIHANFLITEGLGGVLSKLSISDSYHCNDIGRSNNWIWIDIK